MDSFPLSHPERSGFTQPYSFADVPLSQQNYSAQMRARLMIVFIAFCIVVSDAYS